MEEVKELENSESVSLILKNEVKYLSQNPNWKP